MPDPNADEARTDRIIAGAEKPEPGAADKLIKKQRDDREKGKK